MLARFRARLMQLRGMVFPDAPPRLADETRWYTEHTALLISTLKWAMLGAITPTCGTSWTRMAMGIQ